MTTQIVDKIAPGQEQRLVLPGRHTWQQFKAIQSSIEQAPGVRITYLDGRV